jgi:hypothetical protein
MPNLLNNRWWLRNILPKDVSLNKVWKPDGQFVGDERFGWDREDLCKGYQQENEMRQMSSLTVNFF